MLTRQEVRKVRDKLDRRLQKLAPKLGLTLTLGSCRYLDVITFKLEVAINKKGGAKNKSEQDYAMYCKRYNLKPEWLGETFVFKNRTFKISGVAPRSRKYPILATDVVRGKTFKFGAERVRQLMDAMIR